jgi:hypothetical protein
LLGRFADDENRMVAGHTVEAHQTAPRVRRRCGPQRSPRATPARSNQA